MQRYSLSPMISSPLSMEQKHTLNIQGYLVVPGVMDKQTVDHARYLFYEWLPCEYATSTGPHQHITSHNVGHSSFAWFCRTTPKVLAIYRQLLRCQRLVSNFQGCGFNPRIFQEENYVRSSTRPTEHETIYQSFLSITDNNESTIQFVPGSHHQEHHLFSENHIFANKSQTKEPQIVPKEYQRQFTNRLLSVNVKAGDLVIWDSRMLYQETYGNEIRIVQYMSFSCKDEMTESQAEKREAAYLEYRTSRFRALPLTLTKNPCPKHYEGLVDQQNPSKEILALVC